MRCLRAHVAAPFIWILLFLIAVPALRAQQSFLRNYSVSDGLPSNEVYDVFQDSKGFLWFATDAGVSRYDGYHFRNFTSRDGLPDNTVFGFFEDSRERVWFRSYNGQLSYYDGKTIVALPVNHALRKLLNGNLVISLYVDRADTIWLGLHGGDCLLRILPGFKTIDSVKVPEGFSVREIIPGYYFMNEYAKKTGANSRINFSRYKTADTITVSASDINPFGNVSGLNMKDGSTLVGILSEIFEFDGKSIHTFRDSLQNIRLVASGDDGFWRCLSNRKGVQLIRRKSAGTYSVVRTLLHGYTVTGCLEDHENGVWFTTLERGVFYMPYPDVDIIVPELATGEKITGMSFDGQHPVVATSLGQLLSITGSPEAGYQASDRDAGYASNVFNLGNKLVICSTPGGVIYDPATGKNTIIREKGNTPVYGGGYVPLYSVSPRDDSHFYGLGVRNVYFVNIGTGEAELVCSMLPERMRCICKGRGDTIWLGGLTGLWMLAPGKAPVNIAGVHPLLGERIDFLYYDTTNDRLWMSSKGVGLILKEGGRVIDFSSSRPAIAATCRALVPDAEGNIWVATNAGAFCVSEKKDRTFSVQEFSLRNGLSSNDIVGIRRIGDTVWMAASDRVNRFLLQSYPVNRVPPPLLLSGVHVGGKEIADSVAHRFPHTDNTVTFSFLGLSFKCLGHVRYRYCLAGGDSTWKETEATEAVFYRLPPGDYTFYVYALNNDGIGQSRTLSYSFVILPPLWQRWWFIAGAAILMIGAIIFVFRFRVRQVRRKEIFNRRLIEMEMTALRAQMNPHFIFNAINSIHNFVLTGDKNSSATYLSKFAKLIRNVLEHSRLKQISLAQEIETLKLYLEIEQMRFSDGFTFTVKTDPELELSSVMVMPMLLQPYVENAIWHGLLHKKGARHLLISIEDAGEMLRCVIDDDGVGRVRAAEHESRRSIGKTSMGSELTRRRLSLLNDLYGTEYSIRYTDKHHPDGTSAGTRAELLVPKTIKTEKYESHHY